MPITAARPIIERIAVEIKNRLHQLDAGYAATESLVSEVVRPTRLGNYTPKHLQIVITQDEPEEVPALSRPGNPPAVAWVQQWNLRCHIMPSELDPVSVDEYINVVSSDMIKVLTDPGADWHTFGDLAINAKFGPIEMLEADGGVDGFNLPLVILYRVSERDPYSVRS